MIIFRNKIKVILITLFFFSVPLIIRADYFGQKNLFSIDSSYDSSKREETQAELVSISNKLYFYVDESFWNQLSGLSQNEIKNILNNLGNEFDYKIYPTLTSTFGSEPVPGIDKDERITVLIHPMIEQSGGYFNSGDCFPKLQNSKSNEREMVYLNSQYIDSTLTKFHLAHEFIHLITFNQKEKNYGVYEETWLNEARAEYASTLLGYDDVYHGSNLERRVEDFIEKPTDSLTEWQGKNYDYGIINLFTQYLVDHYGVKILIDSLKTPEIGISSINYALTKNGFPENFNQIFTNWTIAASINNCNLDQKYCYLNHNLKNLRVTPLINFLPLMGDSTLSINYRTTNWAGNWQKITGGKGNLILEFDGADEILFKVPYIVCDYQEKCSVSFLTLDKKQKGRITVPEFNKTYTSLTIIPSIQSKIAGFDGQEPFYLFSWKAIASEKKEPESSPTPSTTPNPTSTSTPEPTPDSSTNSTETPTPTTSLTPTSIVNPTTTSESENQTNFLQKIINFLERLIQILGQKITGFFGRNK